MEPLKGYSLPCLLSQVGDDLDRFAIVVSDAYRDHNGGFWYLEGNPSSDSLAGANDSTVEYWVKVGPVSPNVYVAFGILG